MGDHMFVVTGGPGSGKSSLIDAMTRRGFRTMPEAGRAIIHDQVRIGGPALPWADRAIFAELMLGWELRSYHEALASDAPVLMDRGIPDVVGYLTLCGLPVPAHIEAAAKIHPYNERVFLAPYWGAIFAQDAERKQDFAEAERTFEAVRNAYLGYGYDCVTVPRAPAETRAAFILDRMT